MQKFCNICFFFFLKKKLNAILITEHGICLLFFLKLQNLILLEESPTDSAMVEVNAKNNDGFTALEISDVLPEEENIDMKIEKILRRAGALRGRDIVEQKPDNRNHEVHIELYEHQKLCHQKPLLQPATRSEILTTKYHGLLLTATLLAMMTFHAALRAPSITFLIGKQGSATNHLFILFNSIEVKCWLSLINKATFDVQN